MEWFYFFNQPIPPSDIRELEALLRSADVFVPSFDPEHRDPYDLSTYIEVQEIYRQPVTLFVDRNIVTRWIGLMDGVSAVPAHRIAAATIAFAQLGELLIEPSIAMHEYAFSVGHEVAKQELERFYQADNVDTKLWADLALGRTNSLPRSDPPSVPRTIPGRLDKTLYRWQRNYIALLKIAELHLAGGSSEKQMAKFLEWSYNDFLLAGAATMFAADYFAPGRPKRGLLKHIEANNREKAIEGIKNAAWDLMLVGDWFLRVKQIYQDSQVQSQVVLCTMDQAIKRFARMLIRFDDETDDNTITQNLFMEIWGLQRGARLFQQYRHYTEDINNPSRHFHRTQGVDFIPAYIERGEHAIRAWHRRPKY